MKKLTVFFTMLMLVCLSLASGCGGNPTPDPNQGFFIRVTANGIQTGAQVSGQFISGNPTQGTVSQFNFQSINGVGLTPVTGARVPGTWRLTYGPDFSGGSLCLGILTVDRNVGPGSQETLPCVPRFFSFTASPDAINANSQTTVDVTGNGSENLFGTPMIAFYDEFGNVVASGPATQLLYTNGVVSGVRVNVTDISQAYDGTYTALVHNVHGDGSWEVIGAVAITVFGNPPPPPPPPDDGGGGCGQEQPGEPQLPCLEN